MGEGRTIPGRRPSRGRAPTPRVPAGKVLYETAGYISHIRFSPSGDLIAFLVSERGSYITGAAINVDGGISNVV